MEHEIAVQTKAVERYLLGELKPDERNAFEDHYFSCEVCAADVRALSVFIENAKSILREPVAAPRPLAAPARPAETGWFGWLRPQFALGGLAAAFAVLLAVQTATVSRLSNPVVTGAAVLHGESRGEIPVVRQGQPVSLILALEEHPSSGMPLSVGIQSETGAVIRTLSAEAPQPGQGLSVFLPDPKLKSGRYSVVIGNIKYPFEIR
jgi:anti-sigma factor RsiW